MTISVVFIQGGGKGAHTEDALLVKSLDRALGSELNVRNPRMQRESEPNFGAWKQQISSTLDKIPGKVILVGQRSNEW